MADCQYITGIMTLHDYAIMAGDAIRQLVLSKDRLERTMHFYKIHPRRSPKPHPW